MNNKHFWGAIPTGQWIYFSLIFLLYFYGTSVVEANSIPTPVFDGDPIETTSSGHIRLQWSLGDSGVDPAEFQYEVHMAEASDFSGAHVWYSGGDLATYLSGIPDGDFYFRVRAIAMEGDESSAWSEPKQVTVQHHSLTFALLLCALGAVVFLATVAVVVHGTRNAES